MNIARSIPLLVLLAMLTAIGCRTTAGAGHRGGPDPLPYPLVDEEAGFSARMPAPAELEQDSFETEHGMLLSRTYRSELPGAVYVVTFNDFPPAALAHGTIEEQLEGARDGSLQSTGGELLQERMLTVAGHPGLEISVRVNGGSYRTRIVLAGPRMYQSLVAAEDDEIFSDLSSAFLDSMIIDAGAEP